MKNEKIIQESVIAIYGESDDLIAIVSRNRKCGKNVFHSVSELDFEAILYLLKEIQEGDRKVVGKVE